MSGIDYFLKRTEEYMQTKKAVPMSVIEDIKAEIKSKKFSGYANDNGSADFPDHQLHFNSGLICALDIIDKHISGRRTNNESN